MAERNMYRAVDSGGETIEFMLSPKHDLMAATLFPRLALSGGGPQPRGINVDEHPAYASAATELLLSRVERLRLSEARSPEEQNRSTHAAAPTVGRRVCQSVACS